MAAKRKRAEEIFKVLKPFFGKAIRRHRGRMSKEELARRAKMDAKTLTRLENGEALLRKDYIEGVCNTLDLKLEDLIRSVADCYEEAQQASSYQQMSSEELLRTLHKAQDAHARTGQKLEQIEREITRRLLPQTEGLPATKPQPSPNGAHEDQT